MNYAHRRLSVLDRARRRPLVALLTAASSVLVIVACLAPTQVTLRITTDVDCGVVAERGTAIFSGAARDEAPITSTKSCVPRGRTNDIGTLVLAPSDAKDGSVTVSVALGVRRPSETCAANDNVGCIVARRRFRYVPHEPLDLPIELSLRCLDRSCSEEQTCFRGTCVGIEVVPVRGCLGPECKAAPLTDGRVPVALVKDVAARGVAVRDGVLYWTIEGNSTPFRAQIGTPPLVGAPLDQIAGDYPSIAVSELGYFVGGPTDGGQNAVRGSLADASAWSFGVPGDASVVGVAVDGTQAVMTFPSERRTLGKAVDAPTTTTLFWTSHAAQHADWRAGTFYFATERGVWVWSAGRPNPPRELSPQPADGYGLAVDETHVFVANRTGTITAILLADPSKRAEVAAGAFALIEDMVVDETAGALYVAGQPRGDVRGIWSLSLAALDRP